MGLFLFAPLRLCVSFFHNNEGVPKCSVGVAGVVRIMGKRFRIHCPAMAVLLLAMLICLTGCGRKEDLNKAQSVVETSLTSWKNAESPQQLTDQGIEFTDPDRLSGHRLLDFQMKNASSQTQQGPRVVVMLEMQDRGGKKVSTEVAYEVRLGDKVIIGRDAFHVAP